MAEDKSLIALLDMLINIVNGRKDEFNNIKPINEVLAEITLKKATKTNIKEYKRIKQKILSILELIDKKLIKESAYSNFYYDNLETIKKYKTEFYETNNKKNE